MFGLGVPELLIIAFIILLIFGTSRLAGLGRGLGQAIRGFKNEVGSRDEEEETDARESRKKS
jgi:sec-independent protein translocase protein TatA